MDANTFSIVKKICENIPGVNVPRSTWRYAASLIKDFMEAQDKNSVRALVALSNGLPAYEADGVTPYANTEELYKYLFYIYKTLKYDAEKLIKELSNLCS